MKLVKYFFTATAVQIIIVGLGALYYAFAGMPTLSLSSPVFVYFWPLLLPWFSGRGHGGELFVGVFMLLAYSVLVSAAYAIGKPFIAPAFQKQ